MAVDVVGFDILVPGQMDALAGIIQRTGASRIRRLALLLKVGGGYDQNTRAEAKGAAEAVLRDNKLDDRTEIVTVIGCDGAATPCGFALIETTGADSGSSSPRLAIGLAHAPPPDEAIFGKPAYGDYILNVVRRAMADAQLEPREVVTAIVNVPFPKAKLTDEIERKARAVAALAVGVAVNEIDRSRITEETIVEDGDLFTTHAQTFIGPTIKNIEVIVLGNKKNAGGELIAKAMVTQDLLDMRSVKRGLKSVGVAFDEDGEIKDPKQVVTAIVKVGVRPDGKVLGAPTTILTSATSSDTHIRGAVSGAIGATLQTTRIFSTADPVQQAPLGGLHVCCIVRASN